MKRGDIFFAALDPAVGSETQKLRPVLVVSNDAANQFSALVSVLPLSSQLGRVHPFEVLVKAADSGLSKDSKIMAQQLRTLDKQRLNARRAGRIHEAGMLAVDAALRLHLAL